MSKSRIDVNYYGYESWTLILKVCEYFFSEIYVKVYQYFLSEINVKEI